MTYGSTWKGKNLKFDTSGGLVQLRFRYAENTRALLPAKSRSPKFSVSISGGAAADFVAHFSGKHQRDHFLVCPPRPQRMLKRGWPVVFRRSLRESVLSKSRRVARETSRKFAFAIVLAWPWPDDCLYQSRPRFPGGYGTENAGGAGSSLPGVRLRRGLAGAPHAPAPAREPV